MSLGVACYPASGTTPELILAEADRLMYIDKAHRKNLRSSVAGLAAAINDRNGKQSVEAPCH